MEIQAPAAARSGRLPPSRAKARSRAMRMPKSIDSAVTWSVTRLPASISGRALNAERQWKV